MKNVIFLLFNLPFLCNAQIGVNTTAPKAALDIESSDNGILIPRVQLTSILDASTIVNPAGGALATSTLVYNMEAAGVSPYSVKKGFYFWNNEALRWIQIEDSASWKLVGNSNIVTPAAPEDYGTSPIGIDENFLGTTDANDVTIGTNNIERIRILSSGNVGIGTPNPTEKLHVFSSLNIDKSSIFGNATQVSTSADFLNVGVIGSGNGSGSYGFGVGVLGTTDINSTWNSTGVYAQLGTVNPTFSSFTSSNQALVANGNGLGRAAMFLGGNVGIGLPLTSNPSTLLHINSATNGAVRIVDGTEGNGKILTSNATGVATWRNPMPSGFTHYLGELYLGGIIFELYKGSDGLEHGLIVSLTESNLLAWQTTLSITGANRSEDGAYNTALMTSSPAASYIATLGAGWYLPSVDELNLLFNNRYYANKAMRLGGYTLLSTSRFYWSSTESDIAGANALNFGLGTLYYETKSDTNYARGIRQF